MNAHQEHARRMRLAALVVDMLADQSPGNIDKSNGSTAAYVWKHRLRALRDEVEHQFPGAIEAVRAERSRQSTG